ncbi:MAG: hypothetical protein IJ272_08600 [Clostridia bacterium]|nr:hypothetical protein [Clostridia bacterium]
MKKLCKSVLKVISHPYFIWALIAIILFAVTTNLVIVKSLDKFEADSRALYKQAEVIKQDFENVYLQDNYSILPKDNAIVVRLSKGECTLASYFTHEKEFTHFKIEGAPFYTEEFAPVLIGVIVAFLSAVIGGLLSFACSVIANKILAKRKAKKERKGQH